MEDEPISLSVIVPVFNESARVADSLLSISEFLASQTYRCEIIVVDDGSTDQTFSTACSVAVNLPTELCLARYAANRGKGYALKAGFALSRGERVLFTDADLSVPIEYTEKLLQKLDAGFGVAIGSRKTAGAEIGQRQPWLRESMGKVFTWTVRTLIAPVSDATCGFKAFDGEIGREIFRRVRIDGWSFDAEVLWLAQFLGYLFGEVPVRWEHRQGSKVRLRRDIIGSLVGLARLRWNAVRGVYRAPAPGCPDLQVWRSGQHAEPSTGGDA